jgi:hypothetical protein
MALIAVREDDAFGQALEAAVEILAVLGEQVGRELVDRDGDDQLRPFGPLGHGRGGGERKGEESGEPGQFHERSPWKIVSLLYTGDAVEQGPSSISTCSRKFASQLEKSGGTLWIRPTPQT